MAALVLFLALLLALSAGHKLAARGRLAGSAARLAGAPPAMGLPLLLMAAAAEGLAAVALLMEPTRTGGALGAAALWLVYGLALARRLGERLDCGCDLIAREKPVDGLAVARPLLLAALAGLAAFVPVAGWAPDTPFAALACLALWFAAAELSALPQAAALSQRNRA